MKLFTKIAVTLILAIFLLVSLTACSNLPSPLRTPSAGTTNTSSPEPGQTQASPDPTDPHGGSGSTSTDPPEIEITAVRRVIIDPETYDVARGSSIDPFVIILPTDASDTSYTLSSGDESILRQIGDLWTAVGAGTTELIATASNGVIGTAEVTVTVPVESISLGADEIILNRGDSSTLEVLVYPDDATDQNVSFSSSNRNIATIDEDGTIEAISAGTALISVSVCGITEEIPVTVAEPVTSISVSTDRRIYKIGDTGRFTVRITPEDSTDKTFSVNFSREGITHVSEDTFSVETGGEVTITARASNGVSGSQTITIIDLAVFAEEVFLLTNVERTAAGLPTLSVRSELTHVAEVRANEIIRHFSHDRPDGRGFETAFSDNNVTYRHAGENLAAGQRTPAEVVRGWMNSPGHKENMLRREYGHLGVAVAMDSNGRLYWTQMFSN